MILVSNRLHYSVKKSKRKKDILVHCPILGFLGTYVRGDIV